MLRRDALGRLATAVVLMLAASGCVQQLVAQSNQENSGNAGAAPQPATADTEITTQRVVVFKDGYCLFMKKISGMTDEQGELIIDEVPDAAVLGSVWAVPDKGRLLSMRSGYKTTTTSERKEVICENPLQVLMANLGKVARVETHDKAVLSGILHRVLAEPTEGPVTPAPAEAFGIPAHHIPGSAAASLRSSIQFVDTAEEPERPTMRTVTGISGNQFILRSESGDTLLSVDHVRTLSIEDMKTTLSRTLKTTQSTKHITYRFDTPQQLRTVEMMYFRPGLRWIPTYRIQLQQDGDKKTAEMALQAELLNEAEPLHNVPLDIVVGVANFRFRDLPSPLTLEKVLQNALREAAPQLMGQQLSNISNSIFSQRAREVRSTASGRESGGDAVLEMPADLSGAEAGDLFVYHLPPVTLGEGERMAVPIFSAQDVPYRDVYTWDLHVKRTNTAAAETNSGVTSPLTLSENEVWHEVELTNKTNVPWTTGGAMLMQDRQPLAQELLTYTSRGAACRVPVTIAVDVRPSFEEREVKRELNALNWNSYHYARVEKELQLRLRNNKDEAIETEITLRLGGKVDAASHDGNITLAPFDREDWDQYDGHTNVNNSSTVRWTLNLPPREEFTATVKYHYFAR